MKKVLTNSAQQTLDVALEYAKALKGGEVLLINGEMGAGKTVFCKGLALGLGIADTVTSPTYSIHNMYNGRLTLHHFDFYRITNDEEGVNLGLDEYFGGTDCVCAVEWGQNIAQLLPEDVKNITIEKVDLQQRLICFCD